MVFIIDYLLIILPPNVT